MSVSPQSFTSAVNNHKCCMSFQFPPYWDAFHLFHWERPGQYPLTCEENQPTFQELPAINPITAAMVVGGGTLTAGPSHGGTSNSNNELGDTMSQGHFLNVYAKMTPFIHKMKQYVQYVQYANNIICKICKPICKRICKPICKIICKQIC